MEDTRAGSNRMNDEGKFIGPSIWLSLSGGGLRAAIFHYGCLKRLNELGLLGHVNAVSATSGGAIIAALLQRSLGDAFVDRERNIKLETYRWASFEKNFLDMARRGLFASTFMLLSAYGLYAVGILFVIALIPGHWSSTWKLVAGSLASISIAVGFLLQLILARQLMREGATKPTHEAVTWAKIDSRFAGAEWTRPSLKRFFRMLFFPSYLRRQTMNLRAFKGHLLKGLYDSPKLFLTSVDLNSGKEMVFTSGLFCDLSATGCRYLWDQRTDSARYESGYIETAEAVCASSAFPPLFRPVSISNAHGHIGVFVDGGVLDNFALNVPKALAVRIHPRRGQRYRGVLPSFREEISFVLIMDGGKTPAGKRHASWGRIRAAWRLIDVLIDQQFDAAELAAVDMDWNTQIDTAIVGLQLGFPDDNVLHDAELNRHITRVRTHLDSFSLEEIATIAYCGYLRIDQLVKEKAHSLNRYERVELKELTPFDEILPEYCGPWKQSIPELREHLRYSNRRLRLFRSLGRRLRL